MLFSRVELLNDLGYMNAILQDTYDPRDHDDEENSADTTVENFYDAQADNPCLSTSDTRVSIDPTDRLIEAIESLKEVISENTNLHQKNRRRRVTPGTGQLAKSGGHGGALLKENERLKVRKEKVGHHFA